VICELSFQSYTTDRRGGSGIGDWTYLVRPDFSVQPWKSWFEFHLPKGDVPRELQAVLDGIAAAAAGEELEFEAFRNEVTAYWIPPGERIDSTQVFGWLEQLARF
jgi:hypothetical protein